MLGTAETVKTFAKEMLNEELVMVLDHVKAGMRLTPLQKAVANEAARRKLDA